MRGLGFVAAFVLAAGLIGAGCQSTHEEGVKSNMHTQWTDVMADTKTTTDAAKAVLMEEGLKDVSAESTNMDGWRRTLDISIKHGIAAPAYSASLAYYDALRRGRLPGNVIQAQRDFFGGHTYLRTDKQGVFHMEWKEGGSEILQVEGKSRTK